MVLYSLVAIPLALIIQSSGLSPLSIACKCDALSSAELLLKYGANPNGCSNVSGAILHLDMYTVLLYYRASIDLLLKLVLGAMLGYRLLLAYKVNVNTTNKVSHPTNYHNYAVISCLFAQNGVTPLIQACISKAGDIALELLREDADPNKCTETVKLFKIKHSNISCCFRRLHSLLL